jgi:FAD-dependent urate hydroxylase
VRIVIIGGGLSGVASALALIRAGHDVQVFEQADALRTGGYGLILWPNGTGIVRELGVDIDGLGHRLDQVDIQSKDGQPRIRVDLASIADKFGAPSLVIRRTALVAELAAALPENCLRLGMRLSEVKQEGDRSGRPVIASFADGSEIEADVLVGADGHRSTIRRHALSDDSATYMGWATWHGTTPLPSDLSASHRVRTLADRVGLCVMHPLGGDLLYWAFETPFSDGDTLPATAVNDGSGRYAHDGGSVVENLRARFQGFGSPIPELLSVIKDEDVSLFPHILHRVRRSWGRGRITLAGDAAHAVSPRTGMGANQALEDAWMLGRVLARPGDVVQQLREYEAARYQRLRWLWGYAAVTGRQAQSIPAPFALRKEGVSLTWFQRFQIRAFSNYLHQQ